MARGGFALPVITDGVKEEIVVSYAELFAGDGRFSFDVSGPGFKNEIGNLRIEGELGTDILFGRVMCFTRRWNPISGPTVVSLSIGDRRECGGATRSTCWRSVLICTWATGLPAVGVSNRGGSRQTTGGRGFKTPRVTPRQPAGCPIRGVRRTPVATIRRVGNQPGGFGDISGTPVRA